MHITNELLYRLSYTGEVFDYIPKNFSMWLTKIIRRGSW